MADPVVAFAANRIEFLRPSEKALLCSKIASAAELARLKLGELEQLVRRTFPRVRSFESGTIVRRAELDAEYIARGDATVSFLGDENYPELLGHIYDPPFALFARGLQSFELLNRAMVAVVGTRHPTRAAVVAARGLCSDLASVGVPVVSGLAYGIDAAAHRGVLDAGGQTYAVYGCGIDTVYPAAHKSLVAAVIDCGGAVLSEFGPGVEPLPYHFPGRNRIISGLSRTIVVVEAPERSGALITAEYALDHGRDLFVHSVGVCRNSDRRPESAGTTALARDGAVVVQSASELLAEWGVSVEPGRFARIRQPELPFSGGVGGAATGPEIGRKLAEGLSRELRHAGSVAGRTLSGTHFVRSE